MKNSYTVSEEFKQMKYFVLSDGESPSKIEFDVEVALKSRALYIDAFDENGDKVSAVKCVESSDGTLFHYIHDF